MFILWPIQSPCVRMLGLSFSSHLEERRAQIFFWLLFAPHFILQGQKQPGDPVSQPSWGWIDLRPHKPHSTAKTKKIDPGSLWCSCLGASHSYLPVAWGPQGESEAIISLIPFFLGMAHAPLSAPGFLPSSLILGREGEDNTRRIASRLGYMKGSRKGKG